MATPIRPGFLWHEDVALHAEGDEEPRRFYAVSPLHIVRWVQCPRCWSRFWYALNRECSQQELWYHGAMLRRRLLGEECASHAAADDRTRRRLGSTGA